MKASFIKNLVYIVCFGMSAVLVILNIVLPADTDFDSLLIFRIIAVCTVPLFIKFLFYMLLAPWYKHITKLRLARHDNPEFHPMVSVIIPAWNEAIGIVRTIESVAANTYDNFEIIVVNDGSTDSTEARVQEYLASRQPESLPRIVYQHQSNSGKASALNRGIGLARGEIVITIDADCRVDQGMIATFVKHFHDPQVMSVAGNIKVGNTCSLIGTIQHLEYLVSFYMKRVESILNAVYIVGGAAAAYRREVFDIVGFFNSASITEDIEMSMHILEAGYRIHFAEDALVYTEGADNFSGLIKQRLRWKRGRLGAFYTFRKLFFSLRLRHNKFLTWFILPYSVLAEVRLLLETVFLAVLFTYSFLMLNFSLLLMCAILSSSVFLVKSLFVKKASNLNLLPFVFIGWQLFYVTAIVEHIALLKALWCLMRGRTVQWQVWQRKGVFGDE